MDGLIAYALSKKYVDGKTSSIVTGMSWKGTKENVSSLPQSGNQTGDLWHVNEDGNEYAWDGSKWEALGGINLTPEQIETAISNYFEDNPLPQDALVIDWNNKYANAYNDAKAAMQNGREVYLKIPNAENNPTQCTYLQATSWDQTYIVFGGFTGAYLPGDMFIFTYAHITDGLNNWFKWSANFTFNPVLFRNLAPAYSSSSTYDLGDYVNHDSNIYKCTTAILTPEEWNSTHWTAVTVMDEVVTSGGGTGGDSAPFEIPITESGGTYTTTASAADIIANADNCGVVLNGNRVTPDLVNIDGNNATLLFEVTTLYPQYLEYTNIFVIVENGTVTVTVGRMDIKPLPTVTVSDNGKSLVVENGAWGKGYQAARIPRVAMTASDTTPTLDPNKLYVFPEMASLTPTLNTPSDNTIVNEYHFVFESGSTATVLTLPASVLQPDGFTVEANMHYEISILEGAMTAQGWAVTA